MRLPWFLLLDPLMLFVYDGSETFETGGSNDHC